MALLKANHKGSNQKQQHINIFNRLLQKQSNVTRRKNVAFKNKNHKNSLKWYCEACEVILSSKTQAQEHFFGKRHQNVAKSKDFYNGHTGQSTADKKRLIVFEGFHVPSKSSFDQNLGSGNEISDSDNVVPPPAVRDNILETVLNSERKTFYSSDLSIYRTPSGKYYCQPCNVTVNSQVQFLQHSESRKHKHKASRPTIKGND